MTRHLNWTTGIATATISLILTATSCTKTETPPEATAQPQTAAKVQAPAATAATSAAPSGKIDQEITISPEGDNLYFDKKSIEVKAGSTVKLTLKNVASAASNMAHNWVLLKAGSEQQVSTDSMQAGEEKNWVAEGPAVLAHTTLVKPGAEASVTFTAPPAGEYPYICTFPGHSTTMKGNLKSK